MTRHVRTPDPNRRFWDDQADEAEDIRTVSSRKRQSSMPLSDGLALHRIGELLDRVPKHALCLDAGCGAGMYLPMLADRFRRVIGLDFSAGVLRRIPAGTRDRREISLLQGSIQAIPLPASSIDVACLFEIFQNVPKEGVAPTLVELFRVLRPGGRVLLRFKNHHHLLERIATARQNMKRLLGPRDAKVPDILGNEEFRPGPAFLRPFGWYEQLAKDVGFTLEARFSSQLFFAGRLKRLGIERVADWAEFVAQKTPLVRRAIRDTGINYVMLLRKN